MPLPAFHALAALLALLMLARHGRRALALFRRPGPDEAPGGRAGAVVPALNCAIALAVLWVAVKGLLSGLMSTRGGTP
jgi:hypothetical protein